MNIFLDRCLASGSADLERAKCLKYGKIYKINHRFSKVGRPEQPKIIVFWAFKRWAMVGARSVPNILFWMLSKDKLSVFVIPTVWFASVSFVLVLEGLDDEEMPSNLASESP